MGKARKLADLLTATGGVKVEALDNVPAGTPAGIITTWSGLAANIPSGWALCDGANGTPNLVGKFIKAASTAGGTGGSNTHSHSHSLSAGAHTLSTAEMPNHQHNGGTYSEKNPWGRATHPYGTAGSTNVRNSSSQSTGYYAKTNLVGGGSSHSHSLSGSVSSGSNEPAYFELCYIMKL